MKKLLALLLSLCLLVTSTVCVAAAAQKDDRPVAHTTEIAAPKGPESTGEYVDTPDAELVMQQDVGTWGLAHAIYFYWFSNQAAPGVTPPVFDITGMDYFTFDLYVSDADALRGVQLGFELTSGGTCDMQEDFFLTSLDKFTTLQDGWNTVRIPLSVFPSGDADRSRINCFRIFNFDPVTVKEGTRWLVKLRRLGFGTEADNLAMTLPLDKDLGVGCSGTVNSFPAVRRTTLAAPTVSPGAFMVTHTTEQPLDLSDAKYVEIAMHVTGAAAFRQIKFQMELTSSGTCDVQESNFTGFFDHVVEGWNFIRIPLSALVHKVGGGADLSAVNYVRLYSIGTEDRSLASAVTIDFAQLTFTDAADINYQEYTFEVGKAATLPPEITLVAGQNAGENAECLFADGSNEIVYQLDMRNIVPSYIYVTMTTGGEDLLLQIGALRDDPRYYKTIVGEESTDAQGTYVFDVSKYFGVSHFTGGYLFLRIADADPTDGNGGQIRKDTPVTVAVGYSGWKETPFIEVVPPYDGDVPEDEHTIPLFDCNAEIGGFQLDWDDKMAGTSSLSYTLGSWAGIHPQSGEEIIVTQNGQANFKFKTETYTGYDTIDASGMDTLEFWFYVSDKDALAAANFADTAMELTSSGTCDEEEISWRMADILAQCTENGWNAIRLSLSNPTGRQGRIDLSRVNYFRWYFVLATNLPEQPITIKIDTIRLTDYEKQERARVSPSVEAWVGQLEAAMAEIPAWDKETPEIVSQYRQHAEEWRAQYTAFKDEYDAMEPIPQSVAEELGAKDLLRQLSQWFKNYDSYDDTVYVTPIPKDDEKVFVAGGLPPEEPLPDDDQGNGMLWIIGIAAAIVIAGAVVSVLQIKKKKVCK